MASGAVGRLLGATNGVPTAILLVLVNLVPLVGVAFWGWQLGTILVLYWIESGVIGLLNVPRMAKASGPGGTGGTVARVALIAFFLAHYGTFWAVHGFFVFLLPTFFGFGAGGPTGAGAGAAAIGPGFGIDQAAVATGAIGLVLFHAVSFVYWDVWHGESARRTVQQQMNAPYNRVVILHMTILGGAFLIAFTGQSIWALVLLVGLKIAVDLGAHVREHTRRTRPTGDAPR